MDALISAISGLGLAILGLGGVLWRTHQNNGHQQAAGLELLREIKGIMQADMTERREMRQDMLRQFQAIATDLAWLRGRSPGPPA